MTPPSSRPPRTSRWLVALVVSAALHVLLGGAAWLGRTPSVPRRPSPIEFTLVEMAPTPRGNVGTVQGLPRGSSRSGPDPVDLARPARPVRPADLAGLPDLAWAVEAAAPRAQPVDLTASPPAEPVRLRSSSDSTPEGRIRRLLLDDMGRGKVASGLADPFYLDLGRALLAAWDPEKVVTDRGLAGYVAQLGTSLVDLAAIYAVEAARYGRTGSPFAAGSVPSGIAGLAAVPEGLTTAISDQMAAARALSDQSRTRHAALVRVVQRADGRLQSVELVRPSDDSSVDAQALRDLRQSAAALPAPTASALAGRPIVASVWEFALTVSITPPLPMIAVQFDEVLGVVDARLPLDRRIFKLVRLVSLD